MREWATSMRLGRSFGGDSVPHCRITTEETDAAEQPAVDLVSEVYDDWSLQLRELMITPRCRGFWPLPAQIPLEPVSAA